MLWTLHENIIWLSTTEEEEGLNHNEDTETSQAE